MPAGLVCSWTIDQPWRILWNISQPAVPRHIVSDQDYKNQLSELAGFPQHLREIINPELIWASQTLVEVVGFSTVNRLASESTEIWNLQVYGKEKLIFILKMGKLPVTYWPVSAFC